MDMKELLEKMTQFAGQLVGQKPGDQWKGTDSAPPGKKLVGDSILKDLSKGPKPKTKEQELAEQFEQFLQALEEENLGINEKRPTRKGSRTAREYTKDSQPSKRYNTVKEHEDPWAVDQQGNPVGWKAIEDEKDRAALAAHAKKYPNGDPRVKSMKAKDALDMAQKELNQAFGKTETEESRGHKIVATKLKDIERDKSAPSEVDHDKRAEQAKAEYRKYVEKMKKINPNYVPLYKLDEVGGNYEQTETRLVDGDPYRVFDHTMNGWICTARTLDEAYKEAIEWAEYDDITVSVFSKGNKNPIVTIDGYSGAEHFRDALGLHDGDEELQEYGANNPPQQATAGAQPTTKPDPKQVAATNQALQTIKVGTQSTAPTTNIAKALDAASQGKPVGQQDMKALEPLMKDMATVAQDPKLANDFKTLAQKVQQTQQK